MRYPIELVERFGAKAGILMYVAKELPDIPQVDMVVKTPDESIDSVLERADRFPILWPRLFRSSAAAELCGYEGMFPSTLVDGFKEGNSNIRNPNYHGPYSSREKFEAFVREVIQNIENSPSYMKAENSHSHLPDKICVIIAEESPSSITGTYIKHPNQQDYFLISCTEADSLKPNLFGNNAIRANYSYNHEEGIKLLGGFSFEDLECTGGALRSRLHHDLEEVISWHDRIAALPKMDNDWTYQIEFGLDPPCLYQVRPFKPKSFADFGLKCNPLSQICGYPIVIGITPKRGLNVKVESGIWEKHCEGIPINPDNLPSAYYGELRGASSSDYLPNHQVNLLTESFGFLAHDDVRSMRKAQVTVLYNSDPFGQFEAGDWINIISDGKKFSIKKIREPKATSP